MNYSIKDTTDVVSVGTAKNLQGTPISLLTGAAAPGDVLLWNGVEWEPTDIENLVLNGEYNPIVKLDNEEIEPDTEFSRFFYTKIGNIVTVNGQIQIQPQNDTPNYATLTISTPENISIKQGSFSLPGVGFGHCNVRNTAINIVFGPIDQNNLTEIAMTLFGYFNPAELEVFIFLGFSVSFECET